MCDYKMGRMRGDLSEFSNKLRLIEKDLHPFQSRYSKEVEKCCDRIQELETHVAGNARSFDGSVARAARKDLNDYLRYNSENFNDWHDFVEETDKVVDQMDTMRGYVYRVVPRMENQVNDTSDALKEMCKEDSRLRKRVGTLTDQRMTLRSGAGMANRAGVLMFGSYGPAEGRALVPRMECSETNGYFR